MSEQAEQRSGRFGIAAMIAACVIWGLSPLFYGLLDHIPPGDILAHRTLWSVVFFWSVLAFQRRTGEVPRTLSQVDTFGRIVLAAVMISINWLLFIYSIQIERVTESSLGYYIFPLVSVMFGRLFFGERLTVFQWLAVALAVCAVTLLSIGQGGLPWISLVLAFSFGTYGVIKKGMAAGPVVSVTCEVLVLLPLALAWLAFVADTASLTRADIAILVLTGPITALPLFLFSYAAKRVWLSTVGILQYLNPTLQFLLAATILGESFGWAHWVAFPLIWIALAMYSMAVYAEDRAKRRVSRSEAASRAV